MKKIRIGVLCPSEIAFRRFMPALQKQADFEFVGIAYANEAEWFGTTSEKNDQSILLKEKEKAEKFVDTYGGRLFESYEQILTSLDVDAIYLPLPPALHFKWGKAVLEGGKNLLMEKPFTTSSRDTEELISIAQDKGLAIHENYMFQYHSQLDWIQQVVAEGQIGELRLVRIAFGFPFRGAFDFRYNKSLGGGALLDCGGYTVKLASMLLGESAKIVTSHLNNKKGFEVDIYGSATMINDEGLTAQLSFGMDNSYKCELELWGSTGTLYTNRILTAPDGFEPTIMIKNADSEKEYILPSDDSFVKSIQAFKQGICSTAVREKMYRFICSQAELIDDFFEGQCL